MVLSQNIPLKSLQSYYYWPLEKKLLFHLYKSEFCSPSTNSSLFFGKATVESLQTSTFLIIKLLSFCSKPLRTVSTSGNSGNYLSFL